MKKSWSHESKEYKIYVVLCLILGLAITAAGLYALQKLLVPKYMRGVVEGSMIAEYYESDVPHEVLFLGDCEVYENISTVALYRDYGISSYIRGSAQQLTWQSYYLLEDTLRYETPEVVVFNVLALKYGEPQSESYNRMTLDGMRWSRSKWDAVNASMTEDEHMADYLFPLLRYHSRWDELRSTDFEYAFSRDRVTVNGYYMRCDINPEGEFPAPMPPWIILNGWWSFAVRMTSSSYSSRRPRSILTGMRSGMRRSGLLPKNIMSLTLIILT